MPASILISDGKDLKVKTDKMHLSIIPHEGYQEVQEYHHGVWSPLCTAPNNLPLNISVVLS